MGISVHANICFGIKIGDPFERLPWRDEEKYDYDIDLWWEKVGGFTPTDYPYGEDGEVKPGYSGERIEQYWTELREWSKSNPCPVVEVYFGHREQEMIILAARGSVQRTDWGEPTQLGTDLFDVGGPRTSALIQFCADHKIDPKGEEPKWWLSAEMG